MIEQPTPPPKARRGSWLLAIAVMFVFFAWEIYRSAWVGDDAYITLRTVDNFVHGYGLRWNVGERVQSYTHPLWMFLLAAVYYFTREPFYTTIAVGAVCSLAMFALLLLGLTRNVREALLAGLCMIASKAMLDYATSGLENPLTNLIFVAYILVYLRETERHSNLRLFALALLAGLGILNRMDTALIFGPPLAWAWWQCRSWKTLLVAAAGFIPLGLWECFSLFYYGFPFPNTAYAKLAGNIPWYFKPKFILYHLYYGLYTDPQTTLVMIGGIALIFVKRIRPLMPLGVGVILYFLYFCKAGGDFMSGRFYNLPFLVALCALVTGGLALNRKHWAYLVTTVTLFALIMPLSPVKAGADYHEVSKWYRGYKGITDERGFYYGDSGLIPSFGVKPFPKHFFAEYAAGLRDLRKEEYTVMDLGSVGFAGYQLGPSFHIVDHYGLCDIIQARQYAVDLRYWRPGHSMRDIPDGYLETLFYGKNVIEDKDLAQYYEELGPLVRGPLLAPGRLRQIWRFNTGYYDHLLDSIHAKNMALREEQAEKKSDEILRRNQDHLKFRAKWDDSVTTEQIQTGTLQLP